MGGCFLFCIYNIAYSPDKFKKKFRYNLMVYSLENDVLKSFFPIRIAKPVLAIWAEREERKRVVDEALKQYGGVVDEQKILLRL